MAEDKSTEVEEGGETPAPKRHGNTRLPFGLCQAHGIAIGKNWTPRDAWEALKGVGVTPDDAYGDLKEDGKLDETKPGGAVEENPADISEEEMDALEKKEELEQIKKEFDENAAWRAMSQQDKRQLLALVTNRASKQDNEALRREFGFYCPTSKFFGKSKADQMSLLDTIRNHLDFFQEQGDAYTKDSKGNWGRVSDLNIRKVAGEEVYDEKGMLEARSKEGAEKLGKYQTAQDKEIEKNFTNGCVVCLGKTLSKELTEQVNGAITTVNKDFGEMAGFVTAIGGKNDLAKALEAKQESMLTEENIQNEIERIKAEEGNFINNVSEASLRSRAINRIAQGVYVQNSRNALAYWSPYYKRLVFTSNMKGYNDSRAEYSYNANWNASNKAIGVVYHEYGHGVDSLINKLHEDISKGVRSGKITSMADAKAITDMNYNFARELGDLFRQNLTPYSADGRRYAISQYGHTNGQEFVAECFSSHYSGMNNPLATKVVELYKKHYSDLIETKRRYGI